MGPGYRRSSKGLGLFFYWSAAWAPVLVLGTILGAIVFAGSASCAATVRLSRTTRLFDVRQGLLKPSDVAVSSQGRIYIVDGVNHTIRVHAPGGERLFSFGSRGGDKGQLLYPLGIDIDGADKVYIADSGNGRIQIFTADGEFVDQFVLPANGPQPADPTDVAVDESRGRCYVVDNDNHRIVVLDLAGKRVVETYGSPGEGKGNFRYPFQIALDAAGYLYIVDVINTRVQVLNPDGLFVAYVGGWGIDVGQFFRPKGIAVTPDGLVLVSDSYTGVIQVFDADGNFHSVIGDAAGTSVMRFKTPTGLFVDARQRLYVVEMLADKLSILQMEISSP